jgi:membrane-bound lytic murein transglycosylase B
MGKFNVIDSLTSLAYEGRRRQFFTDELLKALVILDQGHVDMEHFKGSWAGAFGQVQFMPSTFFKHAVDFDGDGKKDLWFNNGDALASAANYLHDIGWQPGLAWGKKVTVPADIDQRLISKTYSMSISEWKKLGVKLADGKNMPDETFNASLIDPDGDYGSRKELYLVTDNFKRLMEWNRSSYFATSIGLIADAIK